MLGELQEPPVRAKSESFREVTIAGVVGIDFKFPVTDPILDKQRERLEAVLERPPFRPNPVRMVFARVGRKCSAQFTRQLSEFGHKPVISGSMHTMRLVSTDLLLEYLKPFAFSGMSINELGAVEQTMTAAAPPQPLEVQRRLSTAASRTTHHKMVGVHPILHGLDRQNRAAECVRKILVADRKFQSDARRGRLANKQDAQVQATVTVEVTHVLATITGSVRLDDIESGVSLDVTRA